MKIESMEADIIYKKCKVNVSLDIIHQDIIFPSHSNIIFNIDTNGDGVKKFNEAFDKAKVLASRELDNIISEFKLSERPDVPLDIKPPQILVKIEFKVRQFLIQYGPI